MESVDASPVITRRYVSRSRGGGQGVAWGQQGEGP